MSQSLMGGAPERVVVTDLCTHLPQHRGTHLPQLPGGDLNRLGTRCLVSQAIPDRSD